MCVCKAWKKLLCARILKSEDDINKSGNVHFLTFIHKHNRAHFKAQSKSTELKHKKATQKIFS